MAKHLETQTAFLQPRQVGIYLYYEVPRDPRKTRVGLRMETLFEHILFAPQLGFGFFKTPSIYYLVRSRCADPSIVSDLESLGNFVVDADILISSRSSHGCGDLPEVW
ncbi:hypothetical protein AARAC_001824 [Aspergillus arachidicola]|uniref:Uncharacterized protein n=1 Tax=Aspergillus arachidicola TaxID=656916 RepID=A0A2G7FTN5_9EURO|nr:hypothetical protein AARAC_001824 [Aspergillus arachidicola]